MAKYILIPLLLIAAVLFVRWSFFTVDAAEYAYVTVLGEFRETHDGDDAVNGAGLKFGWPWPIQQVLRLDRRLQQFDLPPLDQLTYDPDGKNVDKILSIEAYVVWKIADKDSVDPFVRRIGSADRARSILGPLIVGRLGAAVGEMRMDDFINSKSFDPNKGTTRVDESVEKLRKLLLEKLREQVRTDYGIDLVDIRLRRFNHPLNVRESIFLRIRAERNKEAMKYLAEGDRLAANIVSQAEGEIKEKIAKAQTEAVTIKTEAEGEANKIRDNAYGRDREFYKFVTNMEKLQSIVGDQNTMLLLSTKHPIFDSLFTPPRMKNDDGKEKKGAN